MAGARLWLVPIVLYYSARAGRSRQRGAFVIFCVNYFYVVLQRCTKEVQRSVGYRFALLFRYIYNSTGLSLFSTTGFISS